MSDLRDELSRLGSLMRPAAPILPDIDWDEIHKHRDELAGLAYTMLAALKEQVEDFQSRLNADEETAAILANYGGVEIIVATIGYRHPHLIVIAGFTAEGKQVELLQHVSQVNVLLKRHRAASGTGRRIGFALQDGKK